MRFIYKHFIFFFNKMRKMSVYKSYFENSMELAGDILKKKKKNRNRKSDWENSGRAVYKSNLIYFVIVEFENV